MKRRKLLVGSAAALAAPHLALASTPTIGVTLPLTGVQGEVARDLEVGYRLAIAEAGLAVRVMDDESVPEMVAERGLLVFSAISDGTKS